MTEKKRKLLARSAVVLFGLLLLAGAWALLAAFKTWTNDNSGFVTAIGLFLVVPCAIWSAGLLERKKKKEQMATALEFLTRELWHNLNYVSQIEESYHNNFELFEGKDEVGLHVPHFGPRVSVLERFMTVEHLTALTPIQRGEILEIYPQLCTLREEFPRWRDLLSNQSVINDRNLYIAVSSTMLSIISPLMRNMVGLWVDTIGSVGTSSFYPQIRQAVETLAAYSSQGKRLLCCYKSSDYREALPSDEQQSVIVCWLHDWKDTPTEVVDLNAICALHDTWKHRQRSALDVFPS